MFVRRVEPADEREAGAELVGEVMVAILDSGME